MNWIDRDTALAKLEVKPQTLYAYVSRGMISSRSHPDDPRASLYSEAEIDVLVKKRRRGRARADIAGAAIAWGDPIMETAITTIKKGRLVYRGKDAIRFADRATLEETASLLWGTKLEVPKSSSRASRLSGDTGKARALEYFARRAADDRPILAQSKVALAHDGADLLSGFASAIIGTTKKGLFHERLGQVWGLDRTGTDLLRRALVLVADHELNPSTFAARVTAATGAPLAACALSGFAALTGPLHGEASAKAFAYLQHARADSPANAIAALQKDKRKIPAVGHALYPSGDPRAAALLRWITPDLTLKRAIKQAEEASGAKANIDMALAALTLHLDLPKDAPFLMFASGRMVGWIAHAIEQSTSGKPIRPRAKYIGVY